MHNITIIVIIVLIMIAQIKNKRKLGGCEKHSSTNTRQNLDVMRKSAIGEF